MAGGTGLAFSMDAEVGCRVVSVLGIGGIGKSAPTIMVMQQVRAAPAQRPCTEKESAPPPAFAGTLVCVLCGQKLRSRKGTSHDYYKDVAHLHGVQCPAGGYLQVRQEVVAHQFGALLQRIPAAAVSEELGDAQQGTDAPIIPMSIPFHLYIAELRRLPVFFCEAFIIEI